MFTQSIQREIVRSTLECLGEQCSQNYSGCITVENTYVHKFLLVFKTLVSIIKKAFLTVHKFDYSLFLLWQN